MVLLPLLLSLGSLALFLSTSAASPSFFPSDSNILLLNASSFSSQVHREFENTFVLFYSPKSGKSKELQPEWIKLAKAVNGMVTVAAVDCLVEEDICEQEAENSIPVIKVYNGKGTPKRYGGPPSAKQLTSFAFFSLPSYVTSLTPSNIDKPSSPSLNRVLLFTDKSDTPNLFKALAQRLRGQLEFGEVKAKQKKLMERYGIDKTPTILVEHDGISTVYEGAMNFPALLSYLTGFAKKGEDEVRMPELIDQSCIDLYCRDGKASLCAVMIVSGSSPTLSDSLSLFQSISDSRSDPVYQHTWLDSDKHADFLLSAFGLYPADYPQIIVLSAKKDRYVSYLGSLTADDVGDWLRQITAGKIRTIPYETKDGKLPAFEDGNSEPACVAPPPPPPPRERNPNDKYLHHITASNFPTAVLDSKAAWLLLISDPSHLQSHMPVWLGLVNRTKNAVRVGIINAEAEPGLVKKLNGSVGEIKYVEAGVEKGLWKTYEGEFNETTLSDFSLSLLPQKFVKKVKGEDGLVSFMLGNIDTPRILLFSKHSIVPPLLSSLSVDYHPHLIFGLASSSDSVLMKKFNVKKIPSLVALGQLDKGEGGQLELIAGSYEQGLKWEELVGWLDEVRKDGVINEGIPEDVKKRYRAARRKEEEKRLKEEEAERKRRRKEEEEAEKRSEAAEEGSCEVSVDDKEGMCTAPPAKSS